MEVGEENSIDFPAIPMFDDRRVDSTMLLQFLFSANSPP
jgi:hypothetical protein